LTRQFSISFSKKQSNSGTLKTSKKKKKMPVSRIAIGSPAEASQPDAWKAALAEFISMVIFVFAGEGSGMAFSMFIF
jgi:hypothetical protein